MKAPKRTGPTKITYYSRPLARAHDPIMAWRDTIPHDEAVVGLVEVDLVPDANLAHPFRFVLVQPDGTTRAVDTEWPLSADRDGWKELSPFGSAVDRATDVPVEVFNAIYQELGRRRIGPHEVIAPLATDLIQTVLKSWPRQTKQDPDEEDDE